MLDNETAEALTRALNNHTEMMSQLLAAYGTNGVITQSQQQMQQALSAHSDGMESHLRGLRAHTDGMGTHKDALYAHASAMNHGRY